MDEEPEKLLGAGQQELVDLCEPVEQTALYEDVPDQLTTQRLPELPDVQELREEQQKPRFDEPTLEDAQLAQLQLRTVPQHFTRSSLPRLRLEDRHAIAPEGQLRHREVEGDHPLQHRPWATACASDVPDVSVWPLLLEDSVRHVP